MDFMVLPPPLWGGELGPHLAQYGLDQMSSNKTFV